jgi:hypothetical protein
MEFIRSLEYSFVSMKMTSYENKIKQKVAEQKLQVALFRL